MDVSPAPISPQSHTELIDTLASQVFLAFIELGRQSLPTSADTIINSAYEFLQRVHPNLKRTEDVGELHRGIQIALLDGLIRLGMPGVRQAVLDSYDRMAAAANKSSVVIAVEPASALEPEPSPFVSLPTSKDVLTRKSVFEQVRQIVAEHMNADVDAITMDTAFVGDLGADSLDQVELVMLLEGQLSIEVEDEAALAITTVRDAVELICASLSVPPDNAAQEHPPTQ